MLFAIILLKVFIHLVHSLSLWFACRFCLSHFAFCKSEFWHNFYFSLNAANHIQPFGSRKKTDKTGNNNVDGADITVNDDVQQFPSFASHPRSEVPHDGKWFSTTDEWKTAIQQQQQQKNTKWTELIKQQYIKTREKTYFFFSLGFEFSNKMDLSFVIDMKLVTRGLKYLVNLTR